MLYRGVGPQSARSERRDEVRRMRAETQKREHPSYMTWLATLEKPSEIAARHERENDDDQAKMERGECCGRCSASGMCGSGRWGWLWQHMRTRDCPFSDHAIMRQLLPKEDWSLIWEALDKVQHGNGND